MKKLILLMLCSLSVNAEPKYDELYKTTNSYTGTTTVHHLKSSNQGNMEGCRIYFVAPKEVEVFSLEVWANDDIHVEFYGDFKEVDKVIFNYIRDSLDVSEYIKNKSKDNLLISFSSGDSLELAELILNSINIMGTTMVYSGLKAKEISAQVNSESRKVLDNCITHVTKS